MYQLFGFLASCYAVLAVVLGAFGAHALKDSLTAYQHQIYDKAVHYQFFHVVGLFVIYFLLKNNPLKILSFAGWFFAIGIFLFSGSLYLLATKELLNIAALLPIIGPLTPLGGLSFIFGWILLALSILKIK